MDIPAKVTSKGQITLPKAVREALGLAPGDRVLFRVEQDRAILARTPDFIEQAGTVTVPEHARVTPWSEVRRETRAARARRRR